MKTTLSNYEIQANEFLKKAQTQFKSEFKTFDSMPFDEDGTKRNIFVITLSNARHKFSFDFGSSLNDSCKHTPKINTDGPVEIYAGIHHGGDIGITFSIKIQTTYDKLRELTNDQLLNKSEFKKEFENYRKQIAEYNEKIKRKKLRGWVNGMDERALWDHACIKISEARRKAEKETELFEQSTEIKHPSAYDVLACLQKYEVGTFENFCADFGYDTDSRKAVRTYKAVRKEWNNLRKLFTDDQLTELQEIN